jgi:hypothetical protein
MSSLKHSFFTMGAPQIGSSCGAFSGGSSGKAFSKGIFFASHSGAPDTPAADRM